MGLSEQANICRWPGQITIFFCLGLAKKNHLNISYKRYSALSLDIYTWLGLGTIHFSMPSFNNAENELNTNSLFIFL